MVGPAQPVEASNRRRYGRVRCSGLGCTMGNVLDLSPGGARIAVRGRLSHHVGDEAMVGLTGHDQSVCSVVARVVGIREIRRGLFGMHREVRLSFTALSDDVTAAIRGLARTHADTECRLSA